MLRIVLTVTYYASFVLLGLYSATLGPTINKLAEHTGSDLATISVLVTAAALGYLGGSLVSGKLYDRFRGQPLIAGSLLLVAAIAATMPLLTSLPLLVAAQLAIGFVAAGIDVGCNTLLVWVHGKRVAPFMNALHLMFGVGGFVAPVLASAILTRTGDVQWSYWAISILALPLALVNALLPSPQPERATPGASGAQTAPLDAQRGLVLALLVAFFFLIVAGEASLFTWAFNYATAHGADDATAAALTSVFWGGFTLGRLIGIPIAARVSPERILAVNTALCVAGIGLLLAGGYAVAWPAVALFGFGMGPLFATAITWAERHITLNGFATGLFLAGASLSSMTIPFLIGRYFESAGPGLLPGTVLPVMLAAFVALFALNRIAQAGRRPLVGVGGL
jgi:MFS transporter, FHS family, Na+ dependent glucose transporter 1